MGSKNTKKFKKADLSVSLLLIIGIAIAFNFLAYQIFYRWDLTQNKIYSISKVSKRTVGELDDIVNVKAYFSNNLPSQVISLKQEVADILDEYAAFSNGRIKVEFIDPNDDEETQRELYLLGIPQLTFEVYEKDKTQLVNGYMGLSIGYADKIETIPAVKRDTSDLEYQITTAIKKVIADEIATIGIFSGRGTKSAAEELKTAKSELEELYTVREISFSEDDPEIPSDIDTFIIIGPEEAFSEDELSAINNFVARGGALMVLQDGVRIGEGLSASKNNTKLEELLGKYGVNLNQNLAADNRAGMASFSQGFFTFSTSYPFWPKINSDGFNPDNSAVSNLENVILPWVSTIEVDESMISPQNFAYLAFTTDKGWTVEENFNIAPNSGGTSPQGERGKKNLAVFVDGPINNAYAEEGEPEKIEARIAAVGDSEFITDGFIQNTPDNLNFFQNLVDILSFDEDLIKIRSKGVSFRPLEKDLSDSSRALIRYLNVFGVTLAVLAFGLIRYFLRRRSRFVDDL